MPFSSPFRNIDVPKVNLLTYLFPPHEEPSKIPIWIDAKNPHIALSPAQLLQWIRRLSFGLERIGISKGEAVMIYTPNHIYVPVAYLGIVGAGYVFSGANPLYNVAEMVHQIKDTGARLLLVHPSRVETAIDAAEQAGFPISNIYQFSENFNPPYLGIHDWRTFIGNENQGQTYKWPELYAEASVNTIATINYSSGTTGLPKGVCVSHYNLIANIEQSIFMRFEGQPFTFCDHPDERWMGFLPLYHTYGQLYTILMATRLLIPVYVMKQFIYIDYLQAIQDFEITTLQVVPPIMVMLSKRMETRRYDLSSVKSILCGAAPLSQSLQNDISTKFKCSIYQVWGMTEVTCCAVQMPNSIHDNTGSVGLLYPNCECSLLDEAGKEVEVGQPGEIHIRGPNICLRYWKNEAATQNSISKDKWLRTGDIAVRNDKGFLWIVDRKKELIKVNSLQVAPAELEAVLLQNEHVADAAVVGITLHDEEWPRAYIVLQDVAKGQSTAITPASIQEWMKNRVAKHKWLTGGVVFIDEVPKLASGKIQRKIMRDWARKDAELLQKEIRAKF